jgi:hypothetical protein
VAPVPLSRANEALIFVSATQAQSTGLLNN